MPPLPSWRQIFHVAQTIAIPVVIALAVSYVQTKTKSDATPPSLYLPVLGDIGFIPRKFPVTYRLDAEDFADYERVQNTSIINAPDTTAVILNWSRFPNVLLITSLLCGPWLRDTVAKVVVWNNSPRTLTYEDFKNTGCAKDQLVIHNSQGNMYFQGRFMACAGVGTPYCFIQDDDFLIRPEILQTLRAQISSSNTSHAIHLLPPDEHLSSSLREIHVPKPDPSYLSDIHTSFAWLGHGTIMHRSKADEFLALMRRLRVTPEEMKMADNYFTILSNRVPEFWFDQDFPLGGGQAFTVGEEGDERNRRHILRAAEYLDSIVRCGSASCDSADDSTKPSLARMPYTSLAVHPPPTPWTRAACKGATCMLETNIKLLPDTITHTSASAAHMVSLGQENLEKIGEAGKRHYENHPPSHAVDTRPDTAFKSLGGARKGDTIALDILSDISDVHEWKAIEMVWLVDADTEQILQASTFESSTDNQRWRPALHRPVCDYTSIANPASGGDQGSAKTLRECSVQMVLSSTALHLYANGRYFRVRLNEDQEKPWTVYEVWLRGL